jgi:ABC-type lipoprotein release transport system permease subunit
VAVAAAGYLVRSDLRARWRALVALALLPGLGAGVAIAAFAGAVRTSTSVDRFLSELHHAEIELDADGDLTNDERLAITSELTAIDGLDRVGRGSWVFHQLSPELQAASSSPIPMITYVPLDDDMFRRLNRPRVLEGRLPEGADEIALNEASVDRFGLRVGDTLQLQGVPAGQIDAFFSGGELEDPPPMSRFRVTGIVRSSEDLRNVRGGSGTSSSAYLTKAYWDEIGHELEFFGPGVFATLEPGTSLSAVQERAREISGVVGAADDPRRAIVADVQDAIDVEAAALRIFGAIVTLTAVVLAAQQLARTVASERDRQATLASIGVPRRARWLAVWAPLTMAAAGAGATALVVAYLASPALPIGVAGRAEPTPGLAFEATTLLVGALLTVVAGSVLAAAVAWRAAHVRTEEDPARPRRLVELAGRAGLDPASVAGVRFAVEAGRGPTAMPVRSVIAGSIIGIAGIVAALTFASSLQRLEDDPARFGWTFDAYVGTEDDGDTAEESLPVLSSLDFVDDITVASFVHVLDQGGRDVTLMGFEPHRGDIRPVIIDGTLPSAPDEIALGRKTAERAGVDIGDTFSVESETGDEIELRVVGTAVLPGGDNDFTGGLGNGGVMTLDGLRRGGDAPRNVYFFDFVEGVSVDEGHRRLAEEGFFAGRPNSGPEINSHLDVVGVPIALAAAILVLAVATLAHALWSATRRRRRDLALLRVCGFLGRDVSRVVRVHALTVALIGLVVGWVAGRAIGSTVWRVVARGLGVADDAAWPSPLTLVGAALAALVVVEVLATAPAIAARRVRAGATLRAE